MRRCIIPSGSTWCPNCFAYSQYIMYILPEYVTHILHTSPTGVMYMTLDWHILHIYHFGGTHSGKHFPCSKSSETCRDAMENIYHEWYKLSIWRFSQFGHQNIITRPASFAQQSANTPQCNQYAYIRGKWFISNVIVSYIIDYVCSYKINIIDAKSKGCVNGKWQHKVPKST